jgi:hypothetical protein
MHVNDVGLAVVVELENFDAAFEQEKEVDAAKTNEPAGSRSSAP